MSYQRGEVKRKPLHPGRFLREDVLPDYGLSVTQLAERLGVSRQTVNEILREKRGLSPDMCHRLARFFGTTPDYWLNMQASVDLWNAKQQNKEAIESIQPIEPARKHKQKAVAG